MLSAIALVVSYFSGPMLNFGDFARYGRSFESVRRGNLWGLPINFVFFSLLTVLTAGATVPVYGELLTDPIKTVERIEVRPDHIVATLVPDTADHSHLATLIVQSGLSLTLFKEEEINLETAFMTLTQGISA